MHKKLWKIFVIIALLITTCNFSAALKRNKPTKDEAIEEETYQTFTERFSTKPSEKQEDIKKQMISAYSESAIINPKGKWDFNFFGSFIYWKVIEDDLAVACLRDTHSAVANLSYKLMKYKYKPGFKVGIGVNLDNHDNWIINLEYIYLRGKNTKSTGIPNPFFSDLDPGFLSYDIATNYSFLKGFGSWRNRLDIINLNLGRPFYSGKKLTFAPTFGLRGGWLGQRYRASYTATVLADTTARYIFSSKSRQKTWLIGPRATFFSNWDFYKNFRLFTDIAVGLYYQHFHNRFTDRLSDTDYSTTTGKIETLMPNYELGLGLGYSRYFFSKKAHIDFIVGYDFQVFMNQNRMKILVNNLSEIASEIFLESMNPADLVLLGLTATLRFDF